MEDVLYPLGVGSGSSRPLRAGRVPLVVVDHTDPRCAPRTRARHSLEKTAGYDAARTARLKRLLDCCLRQRSAHLGSELLELLACLAKRSPNGLHVRYPGSQYLYGVFHGGGAGRGCRGGGPAYGRRLRMYVACA